MKTFIVLAFIAAISHIAVGHLRDNGECGPDECHSEQGLTCRIRYSSCLTGKCRCNNGYVWAKEARKCVMVTTTGEACKVQMECPTGTRCSDNKICECLPAFTSGLFMDDSMACRDTTVTKIIGETCSNDGECFGYFEGSFQDFAVCTSSTCTCPSTGFTTEGLTCMPVDYAVGTACDNDNQCPGAFNDPKSGSCVATTCQCDAGYTSVMKGKDCRKPIIKMDKECKPGNSTHGCVDTLTCAECEEAAFAICTVDNGSSHPVFALTSALTASVLAFFIRSYMLL